MSFGEIGHLPKYEEIPEEFKKDNHNWVKFVETWFYQGLKKGLVMVPKPGVNPNEALRAIKAILASFSPKHEHKMAGCAYLCSEWFTGTEYENKYSGKEI